MTHKAPISVRIGERIFSVNARLRLEDEKPHDRVPLSEPWSIGPITVPVDAKLAAEIVSLARALMVEEYSVLEGPFCTPGRVSFSGTVEQWLAFRESLNKFIHGERGATCNE